METNSVEASGCFYLKDVCAWLMSIKLLVFNLRILFLMYGFTFMIRLSISANVAALYFLKITIGFFGDRSR